MDVSFPTASPIPTPVPGSAAVGAWSVVPVVAPAPVRSSNRVLLVDDDAVARLLTAAALVERGWRVTEVPGGEAALAAFTQAAFDVVVLDALMPVVDGFATCERLRVTPGGAHVPVLMLTGLDDEGSISRAYEAGATDFFVKTAGQWTLLSERLRYMLRSARMREELAASQAKLTKAQRIARLGSWEWDLARRGVRLSEECYAIGGLPRQEEPLPDATLWSHLDAADRTRVAQLFRAALAGSGTLEFECRIVRPDGQARVVKIEAEIDRDDAGRPLVLHGVIQDITDRRQAEDQIRHLANYDSLTGLPNRRFFRDQFAASVERARANGSQVAVLFIDLDRFKQINDTLGHLVGDQLLREIARRLYQAVRDGDTVARTVDPGALAAGTGAAVADAPERPPGSGEALRLASPTRSLAAGGGGGGGTAPGDASEAVRADALSLSGSNHSVARLGGDEFTVLLTDVVDQAVVDRVALRLLEAVRRPVLCAGHELFVTASVGMALFPRDGNDVETLVRKADMAMYAVKDGGRNGWVCFDEAMNTATAERWRMETALHRALERKELVLHYQPKVDVVTGRIVGAEALMRWWRDGTLVPPAEFINAAEESGLIVPITEWAIEEVCRHIAEWNRAGVPPIPVSVNISSRHVQRANVIEPIKAALRAHGQPADRLELELTETVLMQNIEAALPLLQALKALGVSISIDDFGTGYSSLSYLKRLPIDTLKIDRSFVSELESSPDSAAIVAAIIAMSRSMRLRVVAEGVESAVQMQRLHGQGCVLMQGFLFARPLWSEELVRLVLSWPDGNPAWRAAAAEEPAEPVGVAAAPIRVPAGLLSSAPAEPVMDPALLARRWAARFAGRGS
jgi:PAS domain S-box-containing protein